MQSVRQTIETAFAAAVGAALPGWTVAYDNTLAPAPGTLPWARLSIRYADTTPIDTAGLVERTVGIVTVQLFMEVGVGADAAERAADAVAAIFRGKNINGVIFRSPTTSLLGEQQGISDGLYQVNVDTPFQADIQI